MSEDTAPIVVTLKAGTGYDAPWLVIRGYDPDDVTTKLKALDGVIEATIEAAGLFRAQGALGPGSQQSAPPQAAPAPAQQAPAPWGATPAAAQQTQQTAPQQPNRPPAGNHPQAQLHPEGKVCESSESSTVSCGNILEYKKTQSGKATWTCPAWRWGQGQPNGHAREWID